MFTKSQKKEWIRNGIYIFLILLLAVFSTHYIYFKFQEDRSVDYNSDSLDVTYHENTGDKIALTKVIPVTDSVGLSSKAYVISIKNNLTEKVNYKIVIEDDAEYVVVPEEVVKEEKEDEEDDEEPIDPWIPKEDIRISVKNGKNGNKIYDFDELEDGVLLEDTIDALESKNITIRLWIKQDSNLTNNGDLSYHGIMKVVEEDRSIAVNQ